VPETEDYKFEIQVGNKMILFRGSFAIQSFAPRALVECDRPFAMSSVLHSCLSPVGDSQDKKQYTRGWCYTL
ncbi:hypothetical protein BaRGS_00021115, partial [Batillaria attramentaria]